MLQNGSARTIETRNTFMTETARDGTPVLETENDSLRRRGYRGYVGGNNGNWGPIGRLQFDFLVSQGLEPSSVLLDIACGSLRAGRHFIPYLDAGNYLGIDIEEDLITAGLEYELDPGVAELKRPEFVVSEDFAFDGFSKVPDFAIANSLFTHLVPADIKLCLGNLAAHRNSTTVFFASFFEVDRPADNPASSDAHKGFFYTRDEMAAFGEASDWTSSYIGHWGHPRNQKLMSFISR